MPTTAAAPSKTVTQVEDNHITTPHAGQDWRLCANYLEDFSVTTNGLGTPKKALEAARAAVDGICHYPPANFEPHISHLANFLWRDAGDDSKNRLQLGNGASELIDLVMRSCAVVGKWKPGPSIAQYEEYRRSAEAAGFQRTDAGDRSASLLCMVNPTNPTGDYMEIEVMKQYIEDNCQKDTTVIVDESMQMWLGPDWRKDSLISQSDWVRRMSEERGVHVFVMHSWTKIWACTGVRLGSVVAPTPAHMVRIKAAQVPWSVNVMALAFISEAVQDEEYLEETWRLTPLWRGQAVKELAKYFPQWQCKGRDFLSWIWIDTGDAAVSERAVEVAKAAGVPVRSGKPGYNLPTFVRIAVRDEETTAYLVDAWKEAFLGIVRRSRAV